MIHVMTASARSSSSRRNARRWTIGALVVVILIAAAVLVSAGQSSDEPPAPTLDQALIERTAVDRYPLPSVATDRRLIQTVVLPGGSTVGRPLLVLLTGKNQDPSEVAGNELRAALGRLGEDAPIVLIPANDGGSYWHNRRSGQWERYVLSEAIPTAIRRFALDGERVAIGGISMGGAGALGIAAHTPGRFCAIGAHSAAVWPTAAETAPGAYDDAEDFALNAPAPGILAGDVRYNVPIWVDVGADDPFLAANQELIAALRRNGETVTVRLPQGGHDGAYWRTQAPSWLRFYSDALADCGQTRRRD